MNIRVYFNVKYSEKDKAKELGCRWDNERKKWYCIDSNKGTSNVLECSKIWHTPEPYKIINDKKILLSEIKESNRGFTVL